MADKKISALTAATTPLAGTELVPIVQSSATKQVPVSDLTTGRAISVLDLTATGLTASRAVATDANKKLVSVVNTGTGNNVLASNPTLDGGTNSTHVTIGNTGGRKVTVSTSANSIYDDAWLTFAYNSSVGGYKFTNTGATLLTLDLGGDVTVNTGNLVIGTSGKGIVASNGVSQVNTAATPLGNVTLTNSQQFASPTGGIFNLGKLYAAQTFRADSATSITLTFGRQSGILVFGGTWVGGANSTAAGVYFVYCTDSTVYATKISDGYQGLGAPTVTTSGLTLTITFTASSYIHGCFMGSTVA